MKDKSKQIRDIITCGIETVDNNGKIQMEPKDLVYLYKTFEEFNRFFHNRSHYENPETLHSFLGTAEKKGAYSVIHEMYYKVLDKYLTDDLRNELEKDEGPLVYPDFPFYYSE